MRPGRLFLLAAALVVLHASSASGHGYLAIPQSRNALHNSAWCPHCLAGGGPALVSGGARWPNGRAGMCGDPFNGPRLHEAGSIYGTGEVTAMYVQGQVVHLQAVITAFHKGRFRFRICKVTGLSPQNERDQLTDACLDANLLVQANVPGAQAPGDPYFHLGMTNTGTVCSIGGCLVQGTMHDMYYQLPPGLNCDGVTSRCVLQWHYLTGNSCNPPGEGLPWSRREMADCGSDNTPYPEEFWNCADILIFPQGQFPPQLSPPPAPSPPSPPSPSPPLPPMPDPSGVPCASGDAACYCNYVKRDGFFPDVGSGCRRFYMCSQGLAFLDKCPSDALLYNPDIMACDYADLVTCPSDPSDDPDAGGDNNPPTSPPAAPPSPSNVRTPSPSPPVPKPQKPWPQCGIRNAACFCRDKPDGIYPNTANKCRGFFKCTGGGKEHIMCQGGTKYNMATGMCDWPSTVKCPALGSALKSQPVSTSIAEVLKGGKRGYEWKGDDYRKLFRRRRKVDASGRR